MDNVKALRDLLHETMRDRDAEREALAAEREYCAAVRRCVVIRDGREIGTDVTAFARWRRDYDARRAAERKETPRG